LSGKLFPFINAASSFGATAKSREVDGIELYVIKNGSWSNEPL
jgi:hypothetical protein